jgi:demethylmenaquinone methyltransferase/2-methoxy-6-polyprenyl-1,4-benzoquinol methylase
MSKKSVAASAPFVVDMTILGPLPLAGEHRRGNHMSEQVSFGYEDVDPQEKTRRVGAVFSNVAARYDVMNDAMSGGMHRLWKDRFVRRVKPQPGEAILDMAGGTGDIAFRLAERGAEVTVADINQEMLDVGIERALQRGLDTLVWSRQNAETLTYPARTFDAYTIAFGIRNVTHIDKALAEAHRVLRHGGRFFCLEFSTTEWPGFKEVYDFYSHKLVPRIGKAIADDEDSYRYLIESIRRFPDMKSFEGMIRTAGFSNTRVEPILGGLVAIHSGWKL